MTVSPPWRLYSCCPVFEAPITLCTPHHSWPWDDKHFHHFSPTNFYCDIWTHQSPSRPAFTGLFVSIPSHHTSPYKPFCLPSMRPFLHARVMMRTTAALLSLYFWVNTDIHAAQTGEEHTTFHVLKWHRAEGKCCQWSQKYWCFLLGSKCGISQVWNPTVSSLRVVGGTEAMYGSHPWLVSYLVLLSGFSLSFFSLA